MRNKKLIPFEVIEKVIAGEPKAIDAVLRPVSYTHLDVYKRQAVYCVICRCQRSFFYSIGHIFTNDLEKNEKNRMGAAGRFTGKLID